MVLEMTSKRIKHKKKTVELIRKKKKKMDFFCNGAHKSNKISGSHESNKSSGVGGGMVFSDVASEAD